MEKEDRKIAAAWSERLAATVELTLCFSDTPEGVLLERFCADLEKAAPKVKISRIKTGEGAEPFLRVCSNITYQAVPSGRELELFLGALLDHGSKGGGRSPGQGRNRDSIEPEGKIDVYISAFCPFCPTVVSDLLGLAGSHPHVWVNVVDGTLFSAKAAQAGVKSVPTAILDDRFRWTGKVNTDELLDVAALGGRAEIGADTLRAIIASGNAGEAARMMTERGEIYAAFFELLADAKWPVRLGAMVVFEYLASTGDERLISSVVDGIWERFDGLSDDVKADMVHMLGESGHKGALDRIRSLLGRPCPEVVMDAVKEVLAMA